MSLANDSSLGRFNSTPRALNRNTDCPGSSLGFVLGNKWFALSMQTHIEMQREVEAGETDGAHLAAPSHATQPAAK
ncbi:MAG: hypothetical protein ABSG69_14140 [Candidatus Acidiferrum sp.]|jgi:hypothetical protein